MEKILNKNDSLPLFCVFLFSLFSVPFPAISTLFQRVSILSSSSLYRAFLMEYNSGGDAPQIDWKETLVNSLQKLRSLLDSTQGKSDSCSNHCFPPSEENVSRVAISAGRSHKYFPWTRGLMRWPYVRTPTVGKCLLSKLAFWFKLPAHPVGEGVLLLVGWVVSLLRTFSLPPMGVSLI